MLHVKQSTTNVLKSISHRCLSTGLLKVIVMVIKLHKTETSYTILKFLKDQSSLWLTKTSCRAYANATM